MLSHIKQVKHNSNFHNDICSSYPDLYFDWKITVLYYSVLHLIKALAKKNNKIIGENHRDIFSNIKPGNPDAKMKITANMYRIYTDLYTYSHSARYDAISHLIDQDTWNELKREDHKCCLKCTASFNNYMINQGVMEEVIEFKN